MRDKPPSDVMTLALKALAATLSDERRAERLLSLTGLDGDDVRRRIDDPSMLAACLAFLEAHEPDLVAVAALVDERPEAIVAARRELEA